MKILVSACLLGVNCKYDGGNNRNETLIRLLEGHELHAVCPEILGGLPSPRDPAEIRDGRVVCEDGRSVDEAFRAGAAAGLTLARTVRPDLVILKSRSPSCGAGEIYDGTFTHTRIPGDGVFAALCRAEGFRVVTEEEAPAVLSENILPAEDAAAQKCPAMTEKLYYADSHLFDFEAEVLSCEKEKDGWATVLDRTAFYPEGGGQPSDQGTLGGVFVSFVKERDGVIYHCTNAPLPAGTRVRGLIDRERRLDLMCQHSGEHIVSGLICRSHSCDNVGFHISDDFVTIDFNTQISREDLVPLEDEANRLIRENLPVRCFWPDAEELAATDYRSKKALSGDVRLVEFPQADLCACCGTHVARTGEIGLIKLIDCEPHRGGVRIRMVCGARALRYVRTISEENRKVSVLLSAKEEATGAAAARVLKELSQRKERMAVMETAWVEGRAAAFSGKGNVLLLEQNMDPNSTRRLASELMKTCGGFAGVLSDCGEDGIRYAFGKEGGDLKALTAALNSAFSGRGGGKPDFVQGTLHGKTGEISRTVRTYFPDLITE